MTGAPIAVRRDFVTFYSPGTLVPEETTKPIASWDVEAAKEMARSIVERHGARPFAFRFGTRGRGDADLDSREIARSPLYFLGGRVETLAEVEARATDADRILLANMRSNKIGRIITNTNSYKHVAQLDEDDVVLEWTPPGEAEDTSREARATTGGGA